MSQKNGFFQEEKIRQSKILERYNRLKDKHLDKSQEWWFETHGIDLKELILGEEYKK